VINVIFERSSSVLSFFFFSCRCFHVVLVIDSSGRFDADDDSAQYKQLLNTRIWIPASVQNIPQYFPPGLSMESYKVCLRAASLSCCYVFSRFSKSYIQHVDAVIQWLFRPGQPPVPCHVLAAGYRRPDDRTGAGYTGATLELVWPNQVPIAVPVSVPVCVPLLLCHSSYGLHRLSGSSSHAKSTSSSAEWEPNSSYGSSETPCCYIPFLGIAGIRYQASRTILFFFFRGMEKIFPVGADSGRPSAQRSAAGQRRSTSAPRSFPVTCDRFPSASSICSSSSKGESFGK
jgi:hypothetical protein